MISIRASKLTSDSPSYSKKEKTDNGFVYRYDESHLKQRWGLKKKQLKRLEKNIEKLRKKYEKDLSSDDLMTKAVAAVVGLMDDTAVRVGNEDSVKNADTYGATTLKVKHVSFKGKKAIFDFIGKDQVKQHISTDNPKVVSVLKQLIKDKKDNDFIFEVDGTKVWDRRINRYLAPFKISAKDLRGFKANQLMKEKLKSKDFDEALEEVAEIVGHKSSTLKNQYLDPDLVSKYKKAFLSIRARLTEEQGQFFDTLKYKLTNFNPLAEPQIATEVINKSPNVRTNNLIDGVWGKLQPYLPQGATLTSGIRSPSDQIEVINSFWERDSRAGKKHPYISDPNQRVLILRQLGYKISSPKTTPHASGRSFDISGADLHSIVQVINHINEENTLNVQLKAILEPQNNAVHVDIVRASLLSTLSKIAADEAESLELYEAFKNSQPPEEIANEFHGAFGIEQNVEDLEDDEPNKYDREKDDSKWDEVLIDDEKKWTRRELRNYYVKNADKILKGIKDHPVMIYLGTGKNKKILKRNHNDKVIYINSKEDLEYWADRRLLSLHLVMGSKTDFGWVDLDRHDYSFEKTLTYAKKLSQELKEFGKVELWNSGGTGIHVEIHLKKEWNIDTLRDDLKTLLDEFNENQDKVSTGVIHGSGLRSDISTLHEKGNLRAEWAVGETTGNIKAPISMSKRATFELTPVNDKTETATYDALYNDLNEEKATDFATNKPLQFLFGDDLIAKLYPQLKPIAIENLAEKEPEAFLISRYQENPNYEKYARIAILNVLDSKPSLFFTTGLFQDSKYADLTRGAIFAVVHKDPKFFLNNLLNNPQFKEYAHLKQIAENALTRNLSKRAKKHTKAGLFIRVPRELAKDFPSLGEQDTSPPHITALFIGALTKKEAELVKETIKEIIKTQKTFKVKFDDKVSYFKPSESSDGFKVAKLSILSDDLREFHQICKKSLKNVGIEIEDKFPTYKPHITLGYISEDEKYEGVIPKGGFKVESIEFWNGGDRKKFKFKQISKRASSQQFPKTCPCGKETWNSYEEFFKTPFRGKHEPVSPDAHRVQCMAGYEDEGEAPYDMVYGDCGCGSSLVVTVPCMHQEPPQQEAKDPLATYHKKRDFEGTEEPEGDVEKGKNKHRFVIQDHKADKAGHHFDLRLENDNGTMSSWAIKKHKLPSKGEKLLAVKTEDHPVAYNKFHGEIESGYGKGHVEIHDHGTYELIEWKNDTIKFKLKGKEAGTFTLHKMNGSHWILMRGKEEGEEKS